jgi:hypothetical protein
MLPSPSLGSCLYPSFCNNDNDLIYPSFNIDFNDIYVVS